MNFSLKVKFLNDPFPVLTVRLLIIFLCFLSAIASYGQVEKPLKPPVGDLQGYLNLKGYKDFGAEHRPEGWNAWLTLAISPSETKASPPVQRMITK